MEESYMRMITDSISRLLRELFELLIFRLSPLKIFQLLSDSCVVAATLEKLSLPVGQMQGFELQ